MQINARPTTLTNARLITMNSAVLARKSSAELSKRRIAELSMNRNAIPRMLMNARLSTMNSAALPRKKSAVWSRSSNARLSTLTNARPRWTDSAPVIPSATRNLFGNVSMNRRKSADRLKLAIRSTVRVAHHPMDMVVMVHYPTARPLRRRKSANGRPSKSAITSL